jgi:hypothetical protein
MSTINTQINIKTKFVQNQKVRIKETIYGDNGWSVAHQNDIMYVFGFNHIPIGRELKTIYLLLSQAFYENSFKNGLGQIGIEVLPNTSDIVLVQDHEIELVEEQNGNN